MNNISTSVNPFALVRASDYTDDQINSLWVELGGFVINSIIEPGAGSRYVLGGKGSGKTHLLRYHSYQVARRRAPKESGLSIVMKSKFLAIFLRATALDAYRFEQAGVPDGKWQTLFGVYLELRLAEGVVEALCDIKATSPGQEFNDKAFINSIAKSISDETILNCRTIEDVKEWLTTSKRKIDDAVNNSAFSGDLELRIPFSVGGLCIPIKLAITDWSEKLDKFSLIYFIDEVENFSGEQQQVVNSLVRYGEGLASFRVTGRLYAIKTFSTIGGGEENREGADYRITNLDLLLKNFPKYGDFARKFIQKRLGIDSTPIPKGGFNPKSRFQEIDGASFFEPALAHLGISTSVLTFRRSFVDLLKGTSKKITTSEKTEIIAGRLINDFPTILQKLNILLFCKKFKKDIDPQVLAEKIKIDALAFEKKSVTKGPYANAYGHYKFDLFAQICREAKKTNAVPYAGFDTFISMSSGNARNLLIVLGRIYEIAAFKEIDFISGPPISIALQTEAAVEAARFMFEFDTNYGSSSDLARASIERLAAVLRTARYALNIPEVSPLAVSFDEEALTPSSREVLRSALNYSMVFEAYDGRPDRNSQRVMKKIQLNPLMAPRWGLPTARRGDLSLSPLVSNAIFDPRMQSEFTSVLKNLHNKWDSPFSAKSTNSNQEKLF